MYKVLNIIIKKKKPMKNKWSISLILKDFYMLISKEDQ
jgi:hypothetical protein